MKKNLLVIPLLFITFQLKAQSAFRVSRDTLVLKLLELTIRNTSKNDKGFLFNPGNGKTAFRNIGTALQFSVGAAGFPGDGAGSYTNAGFIHRYIKVWRNGLLQGENTTPGIVIDQESGSITFYPALAASEKIYIEALHRADFIQ